MYCPKCDTTTNEDVSSCPNCGTDFAQVEQNNKQFEWDTEKKEYLFKWVKHFSYLTLKLIESKVTLDNTSITSESCTYHLGFIKGKTKTLNLPLSHLKEVKLKKLITYSDMGFTALFIVGGFINPLFFLVAALFIWTGINTSIVITTDLATKIVIPASNKNHAEDFVLSLNELYASKNTQMI